MEIAHQVLVLNLISLIPMTITKQYTMCSKVHFLIPWWTRFINMVYSPGLWSCALSTFNKWSTVNSYMLVLILQSRTVTYKIYFNLNMVMQFRLEKEEASYLLSRSSYLELKNVDVNIKKTIFFWETNGSLFQCTSPTTWRQLDPPLNLSIMTSKCSNINWS